MSRKLRSVKGEGGGGRVIPNTNEIESYFHCACCMPLKPADQSPRNWAWLEVGFTRLGIQVWCKRCECNVVHIDFEKKQHPANITRHKEKSDE